MRYVVEREGGVGGGGVTNLKSFCMEKNQEHEAIVQSFLGGVGGGVILFVCLFVCFCFLYSSSSSSSFSQSSFSSSSNLTLDSWI